MHKHTHTHTPNMKICFPLGSKLANIGANTDKTGPNWSQIGSKLDPFGDPSAQPTVAPGRGLPGATVEV